MTEFEKKMDAAADKIIGPATPEFKEFFQNQEEIDSASLMGAGVSLATHYKYDGKIALTRTLVRGLYYAQHLQLTKDDVVFTSFPKSGSTWIQTLAMYLKYDGDVEKAKNLNIDYEVPVMEFPECSLEAIKQRPSPRYLKSHLPFSMLPPGNCNRSYKIVTMTRNPKDLVTSTYHFYRMLTGTGFNGTVKDMFNLFINGCTIYGPFDKHCLEYWQHRNDPNVLFLTYENMIKDTEGLVRKICKFLGKNYSDDKITELVNATSFKKMAENPNAHHDQWKDMGITGTGKSTFMRKGKSGDWRNHFDEEMNKRMDEWLQEKFGQSDIVFDYD